MYLILDLFNVLSEVDEFKVYIIGGFVDYNYYKGLCYRFVVECGIVYVWFLISECVKLKFRIVIIVNYVFEIMLLYL